MSTEGNSGRGLRDVESALWCPVCSAGLSVTADDRSLSCAASHRFDIARQGYVSLLDGRSTAHLSDTGPMVAARRRVHEVGLFDPVAEAVADTVEATIATGGPDMVLDAGAGTGHYLRATLDRRDEMRGIGLDLSKYCARTIARSHPRAAAVVADVWRPLPVRSGAIGVVLSVFSPRNLSEFARILAPAGVMVVVTPNPDHLAEIIGPMGMLTVGENKDQRLHTALAEDFTVVEESVVRRSHAVDAAVIADVVAMGPSAFHRSEAQIRSAAQSLAAGSTIDLTVSVTVTTCRPQDGREVSAG